MSDYMFMLESHLSPEQNRVVSLVEEAAEKANLKAFLTGGAMRDMLGGFPIRDLDFTIEGNGLKLASILAEKHGAKVLEKDEARRSAEIRFPSGVTAEISSAHTARYPKAGGTPQIKPATIHDDLLGRDFTINAIALSLNKASRGLLLDPTNGLSDLERRELRANHNYALYDDPSRILRMLRLRVRMDFTLDPRTESQYQNVREAGLEKNIPPLAVLRELHRMANEPNPGELVSTLEREKLLPLFSPALTGAKLNLPGFSKLQKAQALVPFGLDFRSENLGLFLNVLTEKMTPKEKAQFIKTVRMDRASIQAWQKLDSRAKVLERKLKSAKLSKPSLVYQLLSQSPGEEVLYLLIRSSQRIVVDRIKNYLQKYILTANEVTDRELAHLNVVPGTPQFKKAKMEYIYGRLDGRIRKPAPPPEPEPAPVGSRMSAPRGPMPAHGPRSPQPVPAPRDGGPQRGPQPIPQRTPPAAIGPRLSQPMPAPEPRPAPRSVWARR